MALSMNVCEASEILDGPSTNRTMHPAKRAIEANRTFFLFGRGLENNK